MRGKFKVISVDHKLADIHVREQFNLTTAEIESLYMKLFEVFNLQEVLILNTCNRVEIYFHNDNLENRDIARLFCAFKSIDFTNYEQFIVTIEGAKAVSHLHRVAMGLESTVIGDLQIMGQVKQAYKLAVDHGMAGPVIHRLIHRVFYCHKLINQKTTFKCGVASISYNATVTVAQTLSPEAKVLIIGAGQMSGDVISNLVKKGYDDLTVTNKTLDKAEILAMQYGIAFVDFNFHKQNITKYDAVISTISTESIAYRASLFQDSEVKIIIDMASPRSIDPGVKGLPLTFLDIDSLGKQVDTVLKQRKSQIPIVEQFISDSVDAFEERKEDFEFSSGILKFKSTLQELQKQSLAAAMKNWFDQEKELAQQMTNSMIQKIINLPIKQIKNVCKREEA